MENNIAHEINEKERTEDIKLLEKIPFRKMMLSEGVREGFARSGYVYPTNLQANAIPLGKAGIDMLIQSKSGTGKTLIFCAIILDGYDATLKAPQSLVLAPTREVAVQIESVLNKIGKYLLDYLAVSVIGGTDIQIDRKMLQRAKAIVGTPGRVMHLIRALILNIEHIKLLVIDEADKFLDSCFRTVFEEINSSLINKSQTIACSATLNAELDLQMAKYMRNPLVLSTDKRSVLLVGIKQFFHEIAEEKTSILEMNSKLIVLKQIFSKISFKQCIVFVNSQSRAESYCNYLEKDSWPCEFISGGQEQSKRLDKFQRFREFKTRIIISTDLLSRGVDSENLNLVINLDVPNDAATYLHRIGRAGRFGSHGLAITILASEQDRTKFKNILQLIGKGMIILKYPFEKESYDVWNFSNLEDERKELGVFVVSDSDETDKENSPINENNIKIVSKQEKAACKFKAINVKKPLSESANTKLTFTVSNSSLTVPSLTLDDASSLTADSEFLLSKHPEESNELKESNNSEGIHPLDLVLDPDSKSSIIKTDLLENYKKMAVSKTADVTEKDNHPENSECVDKIGDDIPSKNQNFGEFNSVPEKFSHLKHLVLEGSVDVTEKDYSPENSECVNMMEDKIPSKNPNFGEFNSVPEKFSHLRHLVLEASIDETEKDNSPGNSECLNKIEDKIPPKNLNFGESSSTPENFSHLRHLVLETSIDSNEMKNVPTVSTSGYVPDISSSSNADQSNTDLFRFKSKNQQNSNQMQREISSNDESEEQQNTLPEESDSNSSSVLSSSIPSSGFEEKVSTEASSGIVTSTEYAESTSSQSNLTKYSTSMSSDGSYVESEEENGEDSSEEEICRTMNRIFINGRTPKQHKVAYDQWANIYWQQMNQIHSYVNMSKLFWQRGKHHN